MFRGTINCKARPNYGVEIGINKKGKQKDKKILVTVLEVSHRPRIACIVRGLLASGGEPT